MENTRITISVQELGKRLGVSRAKAYELVRSAGFPSIRLGGRILVPAAQLEDWITQQLKQQSAEQSARKAEDQQGVE